MTTCILLAAGHSSRFGSPKALAKINNQTIIEKLLNELIISSCDSIVVVLGAHAEQVKPFLLNHKKVKFVYNKDYNFGQTSSFIKGLQSIKDTAKSAFLLPVDYPLINSSIIDKILKSAEEDPSDVIIPTFNGKKGHPPLFSSNLFDQFLNLDYSAGLNSVAQNYPERVRLLSVEDDSVLKTFNTEEELRAII